MHPKRYNPGKHVVVFPVDQHFGWGAQARSWISPLSTHGLIKTTYLLDVTVTWLVGERAGPYEPQQETEIGALSETPSDS
jgi:hypothetical protein